MLRIIVCVVGCIGMLLLMRCAGPITSQEISLQESTQESPQESNLSENTQNQEPSESVGEQVAEKPTEPIVAPDSEPTTEAPNTEPAAEPTQESNVTDESGGATESTEPTVENESEQNTSVDAGEQNAGESSVTDGGTEPTEPVTDGGTTDASTPEGNVEATEPATDGGTTDATNPENVPSDTPAPTANVTGELFSFLQRSNPIVGAEVCVFQHPQVTCVKSDSAGKYKLIGIPVGTDIYITITNASQSLVPTRIAHHQPANAPDPHYVTGLASLSDANLLASVMGTTLDLKKGMIATDTGEQQGTSYTPLSGVTVSLSPQSGNGPYYPTATGLPNSKAETSPTGVALWANVTPGIVELSFSHPQKTCAAPPERIRGSTAGRAKLDIVAGWLHLTGALCK